MKIAIPGKEINLIHSLQGLLLRKKTIEELEIIAENVSKFVIKWDSQLAEQINQPRNTPVATLKLNWIKINHIIPLKNSEGSLVYQLRFDLYGESSLTAY